MSFANSLVSLPKSHATPRHMEIQIPSPSVFLRQSPVLSNPLPAPVKNTKPVHGVQHGVKSNGMTTRVPKTMRAWTRPRRGSARNALELANDVPVPSLPAEASSDVLIRVSHVSLQYSTEMMLKYIPALPFTGPWIPELEFSGEVVAAGKHASKELQEPGAHVVAFSRVPIDVLTGHGVLAEYVKLPAANVVRIDESIDMAAASGLNGAGSTALKIIRKQVYGRGRRCLSMARADLWAQY